LVQVFLFVPNIEWNEKLSFNYINSIERENTMNLNKILAATLVGGLMSTSAFAQNNNTGEIVIQGVVPGVWEITVSDINAGYDFDLSDATVTEARVGTIHIITNDTADTGATVFIESANAGRMINNSSIPNMASDHVAYEITLQDNALTDNTALNALEGAAVNASTITVGTAYSLVVPATLSFDGAGAGPTVTEGTYDVDVTVSDERPEASGVYTDTITFTIMDDN
jgi:hypothetical protein